MPGYVEFSNTIHMEEGTRIVQTGRGVDFSIGEVNVGCVSGDHYTLMLNKRFKSVSTVSYIDGCIGGNLLKRFVLMGSSSNSTAHPLPKVVRERKK